jgi:hypothetical protein
MKIALTLIPALLLIYTAAVAEDSHPPAPPAGGTCAKWGEQIVGMNKFCYYNCKGAVYAITVSVVKECPQTR